MRSLDFTLTALWCTISACESPGTACMELIEMGIYNVFGKLHENYGGIKNYGGV